MKDYDTEDYRGAVMHGYMVHGRTRAGYINVLTSAKAGILVASGSMLAIAEIFAASSGLKLTLTVVAALLLISAMLRSNNIELSFGRPILRPYGALGAGFWHWTLEHPKNPVRNEN